MIHSHVLYAEGVAAEPEVTASPIRSTITM
jgi:hypothetical protein